MNRFVLIAGLAAAMGGFVPPGGHAQAPSKDAPAQSAPDVKAFDQHLSEAQAQLKRMQELREQIRNTQDPQERQRLLQQHWMAMQSAMTTMHRLWGPGMTGWGPGFGPMHGVGMGGPGTMGWAGARSTYSQLTPEQMKQRQYMTDQYLGLQQQMMEHMLERQQWMHQYQIAPPSAK
jgi:hypothetical protein